VTTGAQRDVVIIGSGPAGLTAAIYTARANLKPLVLEGSQAGGQLTLTSDVENFPGFPDGILGPELMARMRQQAARFGAEFVTDDVTRVDFRQRPFKVWRADDVYLARSVIIATGASAKFIGLPQERALLGKGVSTCATCDGFFFQGVSLAVVGGGDSAMEEALFLTKYASKVTVLHRRDTLRASKIMQERAFKNPKIDFIWNVSVTDIHANDAGQVNAVTLADARTGKTRRLEVGGLFVAIGHTPNTALFVGQLEMDERGYLVTAHGTRTSVPGVFACGDVQDHEWRQAVTAAGSGCMAAMDAERYLEGTAGYYAPSGT
jgi:thioredoxin reductase (NADPH)